MKLDTFNVREFGVSNNRVVFFFAGMGTRVGLYKKPINRMVEAGFHVIAFDFEARLVRSGEPDLWLDVGQKVSDTVKQQIKKLSTEGVKGFSCFGVSMGTLMAIKCAADNSEIKKIIINLTYGSVADNVWTWRAIKPAKTRAKQLGYTLKELDKKLAPISPIPNASKLKGKEVLIYLARRDKVLLYTQSVQFKDALDRAGVEYEYIENKYFGHIISGIINFKKHTVWLEFLEK